MATFGRCAGIVGLFLLLGGFIPTEHLCLNVQARAEVYNFTYTDTTDGIAANGQLTLQDSGSSDGSLWATSGYINVTACGLIPTDGAILGTYNLLTSETIGPTLTSSPTGWLSGDDLLYPLKNAPYTMVGGSSYLTGGGLLFGPSLAPGGQDELNIWGNGGDDYSFYTITNAAANSSNPNFTLAADHGVFTATLVPEPGTLTLLVAALLGLAARPICGGVGRRPEDRNVETLLCGPCVLSRRFRQERGTLILADSR